MDIMHVLYLVTLLIAFIMLSLLTLIILGCIALYEYVRGRVTSHGKTEDCNTTDISDIYHTPDEKG